MVPNFPKFSPIIPVRRQNIFESTDWIFEVLHDGFALSPIWTKAAVDSYPVRENEMKRFEQLSSANRKSTQG
jgi:hypothetical protein